MFSGLRFSPHLYSYVSGIKFLGQVMNADKQILNFDVSPHVILSVSLQEEICSDTTAGQYTVFRRS